MNKTIAAVLAVLVLGGVGWLLYQQYGNPNTEGSVKQDTALIAGENILGRWQSSEDAKFTREFKNDGTAVDYYDGALVAEGTWKVFTKEEPLDVAFPLEADAVYVKMVFSGSQREELNFKISRMTADELELIYMDRGGVLSFIAVN